MNHQSYGLACAIVALLAVAFGGTARAETILHAFQGNGDGHTDGGLPVGVTALGGSLYGVSENGGTTGNGTVFKIAANGHYTVLYDFKDGKDAEIPSSRLVPIDGTLYGLTLGGGAGGQGAVFAVTPAGQERVIYSFKGSADGAFPQGDLAYLDGTLYGTTTFGGTANRGTLFAVSPGGQHRVLHSFAGGTDGGNPSSGVIAVGRYLFGTTESDGDPSCTGVACGTIFFVPPGGTEKVLHAFTGGSDGGDPFAALTLAGDSLFGTTRYGGNMTACSAGCGTVFRIDRGNVFTSIYSFQGGSDGSLPAVQLVAGNGVLYGGTLFDGSTNGGTVFAITPSGTESVLHEFQDGSDGWEPSALLFDAGTLYGTTSSGGHYGAGTVFSLVP